MPARFDKDLGVFRSSNGKPKTSDASEAFSGKLGEVLFRALSVKPDARRERPTGDPFSREVAAALPSELRTRGSGLTVGPRRAPNAFEQFRHVGALRDMRLEPSPKDQKVWRAVGRFVCGKLSTSRGLARVDHQLAAAVDAATAQETETRRLLLEEAGQKSFLNLDVTASQQRPGPRSLTLENGLSLKASLRTHRAQDCRPQGARIAALRRQLVPVAQPRLRDWDELVEYARTL